MVLTSDMKKETNKERIYDMMEMYYGNDTANEEELNYIEEISKSTQATNYVIDNMKEYIEKNDENTSEEKKEKDLRDLFEFAEIRMNNNDEYAEKGNKKNLSNIEKIDDITSKYFEDNDELELATKDEKLKEHIDDLKKLVAKLDERTDVFISWINDAIENDEERKIEIYLNKLYDAMEYGFIKKDTEKLIKDLKELNKEAEIDYDGYNIESLVSADKLVLPEGYEYDESLGINNKNSTENQNYISIKVNVKANNKGGNYMNNNKDKKDNKTKGKIKPIFRKFKSFFIKEKTDKKERKPKFRKFKKFMLAAGTKISRMPIYIRNKFVSIKDYLEEEISININKDNNTFEPSDIDIDEDVDDNNRNNEKDIEKDAQNGIDIEKGIQNDLDIEKDIQKDIEKDIKSANNQTTKQATQNINERFTEISEPMSLKEKIDSIDKQMETLIHQITHTNPKDNITIKNLTDKYFALSNRLENLKQQLKEEQHLKCNTINEPMSLKEKIDSIDKQMETLIHQITHTNPKDNITIKNLTDKYFALSNRLENLKQQLKEEQHLKCNTINEPMSLKEKIDSIDKQMETLIHQITHTNPKDNITIKNLTDKYFALLNQSENLKQQLKEEIVTENSMVYTRTM